MGILLQNRQRRLPLNRSFLMRWGRCLLDAAGFAEGDVGVRIVRAAEIQRLNAQFRGEDVPTDVLAFSFQDIRVPGEGAIIGDVVISVDAVVDQARRYRHSEIEELKILMSHGVAHLKGYDDGCREDRRRMRQVERRLRKSADEGVADCR